MRQPKDDHAGAEARNDSEHDRSRTLSYGPAGDDEGRDERAGGRRGAQEPEPGRANLQDVLRKDRKQRDRAAEQDREEVERDRAQQDACSPDEANAREDLVHSDRTFSGRLAAAAKGEHAPERHEREDRGNRIYELGLNGEEDAAHRRACDIGQLEGDRPLRERADEDLLGYERRRQRSTRRRSEGTRDARQEREREERPHVIGTGSGDREQRDGHHHVDDDHERDDPSARETICHVARGQGEEQEWQELREPDQSEVEWVLPHRVHLPTNRDRRHLHREAG